jgi:uncharacterized membrane protein YtjA (UPF0391 family)
MRHLVTAGFLVLSLVSYFFGFERGSAVLFFLGVAFELISLKRLRKRKRAA